MNIDDKLTPAFGVFLKYGYRKTSMDDIAGEIGISRQALYKHYKSKEILFNAVLTHTTEKAEFMAKEVLVNKSIPIKERLVKAMDCWIGQFIDQLRHSPHGKEVILMAETGEGARKCHDDLILLLISTCEQENMNTGDSTVEDLVMTLVLVTHGLVHTDVFHDEFLERLTKAVNIIF